MANATRPCPICGKPRVGTQGWCREHYNEYMRNWQRERYHARRAAFIESRGGCCAICGATENLEIDHMDPMQKRFSVSRALSTWTDKRLAPELEKCQVLCSRCHLAKTNAERHLDRSRRAPLEDYAYHADGRGKNAGKVA